LTEGEQYSDLAVRLLLASPKVTPFNKLRYLVGIATGVRDGELFGLRWQGVMLEAEIPFVRIRLALALSGYDGPNTLQDRKTEDSVRDIPLHPRVVEALRWWWSQGWVQWVGRHPTGDDFVFPNLEGVPCRRRSAEDLRNDLVLAGASPTFEGHNITIHALRRTFSTWLDSYPEAHLVKKDLMWDADKDSDRSHYAATSVERKQRAVNSMPIPATAAEITNDAVSLEQAATDGSDNSRKAS